MKNLIRISLFTSLFTCLFNVSCNGNVDDKGVEVNAEAVKEFIVKNYESSSKKNLVKFTYSFDGSKTTNEDEIYKLNENLKDKAKQHQITYKQDSLLLTYDLLEGNEFDYEKGAANVKIDTIDIDIFEDQKSDTNTFNYYVKDNSKLTIVNKKVIGKNTQTYTRVYNELGQRESLVYDSYEKCEDFSIIASVESKTYSY